MLDCYLSCGLHHILQPYQSQQDREHKREGERVRKNSFSSCYHLCFIEEEENLGLYIANILKSPAINHFIP